MPTYNALLLPPSVSLPSGVENYAGECRLATRYPFSGGDLEFDQQTSGSDPSGWTVVRPGTPSVDLGVAQKNYFTMKGGFSTFASGTFPRIYRSITGDFDVFGCVWGQMASTGLVFVGLIAADGNMTDGTKAVSLDFRFSSGNTHWWYVAPSTSQGTNSDGVGVNNDHSRAPLWYRLARSGNTWSGYFARTRIPAPWTQMASSPVTSTAVSSTCSLGFLCHADSAWSGHCRFSPMRTWPPFLTSSPQIIKEYDSGINGTSWNLATFAERLVNDPRDYATAAAAKLYSYVANDASGTSFAQTDRTLAQVQAGGTLTGRYLRMGVKLPSDGLQDTRWNGATVAVTAGVAGSGVSYSRVFGGL